MTTTASMTTIALGPLMLLMIIMVIGLGIFLFIKPGRRGRVILVACSLALILLPVGLVVVHFFSSVVVRDGMNTYPTAVGQTEQPAMQPHMQSQAAFDLSPEPWKSAADLEFAADLHPSAAAAAESLVVEILKLKDATYPAVDIQRVQVWAADGLDAEVVSRTLHQLHRKAPGWMVMVEAMEPAHPIEQGDEQAATLRLEVPSRKTMHQAAWDHRREELGGTLRMRLSFSGRRSIERSTKFTDKPWVRDTSEFVSARPETKWVVGYSSSNATDRAEARQQAVRSAAVQILPEIRARLQHRAPFDERWLLAAIEKELARGSEVTDRFVQTMIVNSGGQVVREAVLVQSPAVIDRVEQASLSHLAQTRHEERGQRRTWIALIASAAGMVLFICVVGLVLNTITKGYYRGHVMLAVGMMLVLGALVLVRFKATVQPSGRYEPAVHVTEEDGQLTPMSGYVQE